jgi:hypothetical protein
MPWTRKLPTPIKLSDGRTIVDLGDAREVLLSIPARRRRIVCWRLSKGFLKEAVAERSPVTKVQEVFLRALKAEGLL